MLAFAAVDVLAGAAEGASGWTEGELYREAYFRGPTSNKMNTAGSSLTRVAKRLRFDDDGGRDFNHQGPPQFCQEVNIKRGKKRRSLKRLLKKIDRSNVTFISRWQSLKNDYQEALNLSQSLSYYKDLDKLYLPVYAFNVSALSYNKHNNASAVVDAFSYPCYRLTKDISGTNNKYRWDVVTGINNQNGTTDNKNWQTESLTQPFTGVAISDYTLDWVNFRAMIKGAHDLDSQVDIYECSFLTDGGPVRQFYVDGSGDIKEDVEPTGDVENETTAFWDHYLAARTVHPFRTSMLPKNTIDKYWKIYRHKRISFSPVSDGNKVEGALGDAVGYMKCLNLFMRYDVDIPLRSVNINADSTNSRLVVGGVDPQPLGYITNPPGDAQCTVFGPRAKDRWIVISAHANTKSASAGENPTKYCSFDLCVRQKVLFDQ